jgi:hypothetical protein
MSKNKILEVKIDDIKKLQEENARKIQELTARANTTLGRAGLKFIRDNKIVLCPKNYSNEKSIDCNFEMTDSMGRNLYKVLKFNHKDYRYHMFFYIGDIKIYIALHTFDKKFKRGEISFSDKTGYNEKSKPIDLKQFYAIIKEFKIKFNMKNFTDYIALYKKDIKDAEKKMANVKKILG